jgi:hypothetical protein
MLNGFLGPVSNRMVTNAPPTVSFSVLQAEGRARTGQLTTAAGVISTPASLLYTRRGAVMSMTPDVIEKLESRPQGVQIDVLQL